jgi:hypothetical protein
MTALWISLAVVIVVLLLTWRLRKAAKVLDRIVREELAEEPDPEVSEAESRNQ